MRHLSQYEATLIRGRHLSPHVGPVVPAYPSLLDGPGGDQLLSPTKAEQWSMIVPGLPIPDIWIPGSEAASPLADRGLASLSFPSMAGAPTYQQSISGSALPWITVPQTAGAGFRIDTLTIGPDPGMPLFAVFDFRATATGGARTLFTVSPNALVQLTTGGLVSLVVTNSTTVNGAVDLRSATARHRICIYWEPGDTNRGGPVFRTWTRHETVAVTAGGGPGGVLSFAGAGTFGIGGALTPPALTWRGLAIWTGSTARKAANLGGTRQGGRTILVRSGATVLY